MTKTVLFVFLSLIFSAVHSAEPVTFEVRDNSYQVCNTEQQYRQLLNYSLYGVGKAPDQGCFFAPTGAKAIILQCPESDIILCQFSLKPDGANAIEVWASKVMLREIE
ncbi:hypothetical protein [Amphritea balenae]|uniref:hypothetical protein n=1 Tax=Amphritea balenae TaxID=452629 RepID=UPI0016662B6F|nr:hypothetical protein [Amphritea balenae]GGK54794.1 hypothetical protein GCM10007941_01020 [Amphritea balenae]